MTSFKVEKSPVSQECHTEDKKWVFYDNIKMRVM